MAGNRSTQLEPLSIPVRNMATPACAECVRRALTCVAGVEHVEVDRDGGFATVRMAPGRVATGELSDALEAAGYEVRVAVHTAPCPPDEASCQRVARALREIVGVLDVSTNGGATTTVRHWDSPAVAAQVQRALGNPGGRREEPAKPQPAEASAWTCRARWGCLGACVSLAAAMAHRLSLLPSVDSRLLETVAGVASAAVVVGAGLPLFVEACRAVASSHVTYSVYVVLSATAALLYSAIVCGLRAAGVATLEPDAYFDLAALLVAFALLGRSLTERARQASSESIRKRIDVRDRSVVLLVEGREECVPVHALNTGDRVVVLPGVRIPVDGAVVEGVSAVDESMVTGESLLAEKVPGSEVVSGSLNRTGRLVVEASRVRGDTVLAQIVSQFRRARGTKLPFLATSEHVAFYAALAMLGGALLTFLLWLAYGSDPKLPQATRYAVAVLMIGCPCALGFAEPLLNAAAIRRARELGIVIKAPEAVELSSQLSCLLLDKTGTLTLGYPELVEVVAAPGQSRERVLACAAAVERHSDHPVARAILRTASREGVAVPQAGGAAQSTWDGTAAEVDGHTVALRRFQGSAGDDLALQDCLRAPALKFAEAGEAVAVLLIDREPAGVLAVADPAKPESKSAVDELHRLGLRVAMVTGDSRPVAEHLGKQLGLDRVTAEVMPGGKTNETRRLQAGGELVGVVGDGFNDAPALAQADVGIAMASSEDITLEAADVALTSDDPLKVPLLVRLARRTTEATVRSTVWAFACHGVLLPIAVGVVPQSTGIQFAPTLAIAAALAGAVLPLGYALRLRRWRP